MIRPEITCADLLIIVTMPWRLRKAMLYDALVGLGVVQKSVWSFRCGGFREDLGGLCRRFRRRFLPRAYLIRKKDGVE